MEILLMVMIFILGLCLGSFVNMLVYRVAVKYKLISKSKFIVADKNRSFCDGCGRQLRWYENVPVISWLIQKGKSRCCQKKLSFLYPIVELITGILLMVVVFRFNLLSSDLPIMLEVVRLFFAMVLITLLVFSAVFDIKYLILPDFATITLIVMSFLGVVFDEPNIIPYLLSALGAFSFLGVLYLVTKGKGMGFGDVKLAIFMGLFLGYPNIIIAIYIAFIVGALVGLMGMISKKMTKKTQIPFGPFLILGTFVAWVWGNKILDLVVFQFFR